MTIKMGEKIKALRKRKGISQEALAQMLGLSFQAVSKWETGATMPDISLIPSIAAFFDVSTDELFDYNVLENQRKAEEICRAAAALRNTDPAKAEEMLRDGLKQFPADESLLTVLLYALLAMDGRKDDIIEVCTTLIEYSQTEGVKYDVIRILAETYAALGKQEQAEAALELIPEFYFTKTEWQAKLLKGDNRMEAARFQMNLSASSTVEMLLIMADCYTEQGHSENAAHCRRIAAGVLDTFIRENGTELELPGYEWIQARLTDLN